jgi:hypothetical protein
MVPASSSTVTGAGARCRGEPSTGAQNTGPWPRHQMLGGVHSRTVDRCRVRPGRCQNRATQSAAPATGRTCPGGAAGASVRHPAGQQPAQRGGTAMLSGTPPRRREQRPGHQQEQHVLSHVPGQGGSAISCAGRARPSTTSSPAPNAATRQRGTRPRRRAHSLLDAPPVAGCPQADRDGASIVAGSRPAIPTRVPGGAQADMAAAPARRPRRAR